MNPFHVSRFVPSVAAILALVAFAALLVLLLPGCIGSNMPFSYGQIHNRGTAYNAAGEPTNGAGTGTDATNAKGLPSQHSFQHIGNMGETSPFSATATMDKATDLTGQAGKGNQQTPTAGIAVGTSTGTGTAAGNTNTNSPTQPNNLQFSVPLSQAGPATVNAAPQAGGTAPSASEPSVAPTVAVSGLTPEVQTAWQKYWTSTGATTAAPTTATQAQWMAFQAWVTSQMLTPAAATK